jgi:hypothetical protein
VVADAPLVAPASAGTATSPKVIVPFQIDRGIDMDPPETLE